jgi:adenosylmethionine-8-amino-7-oxononanoate aminotransferase
MSALFYRDLNHPPMAAVVGVGSGIVRVDGDLGTDLLDLSSGAGITCLGHSCTSVKNAMYEQIHKLPYVHAMNWSNAPAEQLAGKLLGIVSRSDDRFQGGRVIFLNSGAEAVEAACKVGMQIAEEEGRQHLLFSRLHSYHGNTMFTLALGDHPRKHQWRQNLEVASGARLPAFAPSWQMVSSLDLLATTLRNIQPVGYQPIVVVETIGGTTIGIEPPTQEYLRTLRMLCDASGAILIFDEVLSGNYRTGQLFACQHYGVMPDIICVGKGLTAGYFPLSAVIVCKPLVDRIKKHSGKLWHSTTNQNHPIGCAAGVAALDAYESRVDRIHWIAKWIEDLRPWLLQQPGVRDLVGVGALWGLRLDPDLPGLHLRVRALAPSQGVVVYTEGQTVHGQGNFVLLAPPYCITQDELVTGLRALCRAIGKAFEVT